LDQVDQESEMLRTLPFIIEVVLLVACVVDAVQSPPERVRNLPRWTWVLLIVLVPFAGPIAWLFAGRPRRGAVATPVEWPLRDFAAQPRTIAPDDDPEFLRTLKKQNDHEARLREWEEDLRRREEGLDKSTDDPEETP
jgi:hypothetical protein